MTTVTFHLRVSCQANCTLLNTVSDQLHCLHQTSRGQRRALNSQMAIRSYANDQLLLVLKSTCIGGLEQRRAGYLQRREKKHLFSNSHCRDIKACSQYREGKEMGGHVAKNSLGIFFLLRHLITQHLSKLAPIKASLTGREAVGFCW